MRDEERERWSFRCSSCGKCCNSAPQMSVPELLYHQHSFIGCLAIRRVPRLRSGDRLGRGRFAATADGADCAASADLAEQVLLPLSGNRHEYDILLAAQAFSSRPSDPCDALGRDGRCTIHDDRKPATCSVVPLDPLLPDRLQHAVLAARSEEAGYFGADCIVPGPAPGFASLTERRAVVDPEARHALARRRRDLADEKRWWGEAVFAALYADLFGDAAALAHVPVQGHLVMSLAPALQVIAVASPRCRRRCLEYLDAQIALIEASLRRVAARKRPVEPPETRQLRAFGRTNEALRTALAGAPAPAGGSPWARDATALEAWLGLASDRAHTAAAAQERT